MAWLLVLTFGWVGCIGGDTPPLELTSPFTDTGGPRVNGNPARLVANHTPEPGATYLYLIRLQIFPVTVPAGSVSGSERMWRYLDEEVGDVQTLATLNRNGFRIGRGKQDDWPAVAALLREMTGQTLARIDMTTRPGKVMPLQLNADMPTQRIFTFNARGELRGRDYAPGDNVLMITCRLNPDKPADVVIQAAPAVRVHSTVPRVVRTPTGVRYSHEPVTVSIDSLEFTARVPQGHYLVIGPGAASRRSTSAGHQFLTSQTEGLQYESLLVLVPQVWVIEVSREGV